MTFLVAFQGFWNAEESQLTVKRMPQNRPANAQRGEVDERTSPGRLAKAARNASWPLRPWNTAACTAPHPRVVLEP